jgi:hypothetical protein
VGGRGQQALSKGVTVLQGLIEEERFFKQTEPWNQHDKSLFGVEALRKKLETLQINMIQESFPNIVNNIRQELKNAENELNKLGDDMSTSYQRLKMYNQLINNYIKYIADAKEGSNCCMSSIQKVFTWLSEFATIYKKFRDKVLKSNLATFLNEHEKTNIDNLERSNNYKMLKKLIESRQTRNLPCLVSAELFNDIIKEMILEQWIPLVRFLYDNCYVLVKKLLSDAANNTHMQKSFSRLNMYVNEESLLLCDELMQKTWKFAENLLTSNQRAYTQNKLLFENINKVKMAHFQNTFANVNGAANTPILTQMQPRLNLFGSRSMEDYVAYEMCIIIDAYGSVASKRLIDEIPMILNQMLDEVPQSLREKLQTIEDKQLKLLFNQPAHVEMERKKIQEKFDTLKRALDALKKMNSGEFFENYYFFFFGLLYLRFYTIKQCNYLNANNSIYIFLFQ